MRITFVLQYYHPYVGGLESLFRNLAEGLAGRGHNIHVLTTRLHGTPLQETINGVRVERVGVPPIADRYFFTLAGIPSAFRLARSSDLVHTAPYNGALPGFLSARLAGKPVVFTALEVLGSRWLTVEPNPVKAILYSLFEKTVTILPYDRIAAISKATLTDAVSAGMNPERGRVIYPGVDASFSPGTATGDLRRSIGLDATAFVYLYFGRPGITKGVDVLLRASPMIDAEIPNAHLVLILAKEPKAQYARLRKIAAAHDTGHIHFVSSVPREDLVGLLRDANCIVVPSLTEGFGLTTAEACALGIPVVATSAGSIPEVISGKHVLVQPGLAGALRDGVVCIARGGGSETLRKNFSWDAMLDEYEGLYRELFG